MVTVENLPRLLEFGGIYYYEIERFIPALWEMGQMQAAEEKRVVLRTFNKKIAESRLAELRAEGEIVRLSQILVQFDSD